MSSKQGAAPIEWILTENLLLDAENARLASLSGDGSQENLLRILWSEMAVDEVALSIAENGWFYLLLVVKRIK